MSRKLKIWTVCFSLFFSVGAMTVLLLFSSRKAIAVAEVITDSTQLHVGEMQEDNQQKLLHFIQKDADKEFLFIPLEEGISADAVSMENKYLDGEIWIYIKNCTSTYYDDHYLYGNSGHVTAAYYEMSGGSVILKLKLDMILECESMVTGGCISVHFVPPKELYDKIAVIDLYPSDSQSEEILLGIQEAIKELPRQNGIRIYYLYSDECSITDTKKAWLVKEMQADYLVQLSLNESQDPEMYGIEACYSKEYFIPGFGNIEFANLCEREITVALCNRANGLHEAAEDNELLQKSIVPSVQIRLGYVTNTDEQQLLKSRDYQKKAAEGILNALQCAWDEKGET